MPTIAVASVAGSPGVTSTTWALANAVKRASASPQEDRPEPVVVEADPRGESLRPRLTGLVSSHSPSTEPSGLRNFGAALRLRNGSQIEAAALRQLIDKHVGQVNGVHLVGPEADLAKAAETVASYAPLVAKAFHYSDRWLGLVDLGRLYPNTPAAEVLPWVDQLLLIVWPHHDLVATTRHWLRTLPAGTLCRIVTVGDRPLRPENFAESLPDAPMFSFVADRLAPEIFMAKGLRRRLRNSQWWRSVRALEIEMHSQLSARSRRPIDLTTTDTTVDEDACGAELATESRPA